MPHQGLSTGLSNPKNGLQKGTNRGTLDGLQTGLNPKTPIEKDLIFWLDASNPKCCLPTSTTVTDMASGFIGNYYANGALGTSRWQIFQGIPCWNFLAAAKHWLG